MKALILEDENIAAKRLKRLIEELNPNIDVIASFVSIHDIASYLLKAEEIPDLLFLDIHVLDGNSMELFNLVKIESKVIFTTAYDEYAVEAFRKNAIDYLLKPIKKDQLAEAINRAQAISLDKLPRFSEESKYKTRFLIKFGSKIKTLKTEEIAYIYSLDKVSFFYTKEGQKVASDFKLQDLESILDPAQFFRLNRQFIAHIDAVGRIQSHNSSRLKIDLKPPIDEEIVISTERTKAFKRWMDGRA